MSERSFLKEDGVKIRFSILSARGAGENRLATYITKRLIANTKGTTSKK